jgi:ribonuclease-3
LRADVDRLARQLGYAFRDADLLEAALTHRSAQSRHNERLEFLGDAVLGLVSAEALWQRFPDATEGQLTRLRAQLVKRETLAAVARDLALGQYLRLGPGELRSGGHARDSILADALEAVIGAVYLDGGWAAAAAVVLDLFDEAILRASEGPGVGDHKTRLQELVARHFGRPPVYRLQDEGPDHDKRFFATVVVAGVVRGSGTGSSKKQAEQDAAREAWEQLSTEIETGGASRQAGG